MDQIEISFVTEEGACRRLLGLLEWKGGRLTSLQMAEEADGALSRLRVKYACRADERRSDALVAKIRGMPGVVNVTRGVGD